MVSSKLVACVALACVSVALAYPADDKVDKQNMMYTFGSKEEIPAAFFDTTPLEKNSQPRNNTSEPRAYPACQDGSGGMCVDAGTCPSDKKPETYQPGACASGQECCFGPPSTDKTCRSRGGECKATRECGSAPTFLEAVDFDQKNGQICCILI